MNTLALAHPRPARAAALLLLAGTLLLAGCSSESGRSCAPGSAGCACTASGTCNDAGLRCDADQVCRELTCSAGSEGCACRPDRTCDAVQGGPMLVCNGNTCMQVSCSAGSLGCPCSQGTCSAGICSNGFCVPEDSATPPSVKACYSPCQRGLSLADGTYVACGADGLMARCLDGKTCTNGSCVAPGAPAPTCSGETDCPDFQTCIDGRCYSNCSSNADCSGDRVCFRHVCRTRCTAASDTCPPATACVITDGETGHCLPVRPPAGAPVTAVLGTFALSADALAFSNIATTGSVTIRNDAPAGMTFTIRKLDHTEYRDAGPVHVTNDPLPWIAMGADKVERVREVAVFVEGNGGTREITFGGVSSPDLARWDGRVEVSNPELGKRVLSLGYVQRQDGRWSGKMYYFANFGELGLARWEMNREDATALSLVGNAFVQRWGALRQGRITYDEFQAVVTSTRTGSWSWPSMRNVCTGTTACYPYSAPQGYGLYSDDLSAYPIPTAMSELPIAVNLTTSPTDPLRMTGKIVSADSLQYAGEPALTVAFASDPAACKANVGTACLAPIASLDARIVVGGRYLTRSSDSGCTKEPAGTYRLVATPWIVPGFNEGTELDATSGYRYRYECRDNQLPFGAGWDAQNASLAQSNPIPDGRSRRRHLEVVDGALINQSTIFVIFRERFEESFLADDSEGFSAYGFMVLSRTPADLDAGAYEGHAANDARPAPTDVLQTACKADLVTRLLGPGQQVSPANVSSFARSVLDGVAPGASAVPITDASLEKVHYLCHDTGLFDGGADDTPALGIKIACPAGSGVTFFTSKRTSEQIALESCQHTGSCQDTLDLWMANGTYGTRVDPAWRCTDTSKVYCDTDRLDLRAEKTFFAANTGVAFPPLLTVVDGAFRYKTQFRSRTGSSVGFAPEICVPGSNAIPYCYDPTAIEQVRDRADCAIALYSREYDSLDPDARSRLKAFLTHSFGYLQEQFSSWGTPLSEDGFEKLNAELLIMQGDEAYTRAFASRFDLAGSRMVSFEGSLFEPSGMNLAGAAGNEMYNLYQAAQYYQLVLDRFYALSPYVWQSVKGDIARNFVGKETVVAYFDRLIRASTQKSRAWSEVAKRYQSFNRPDLARHVIERAYSAAYLESIILSRLMLRVVAVADPGDRDFIASRADLASLGYRAALLDMRDVWSGIVDEPTYFGFATDYMPFPALEPGDVNAFTKLLNTAKQSVTNAATKESQALSSTRAYDTDAAQFQAELVRLRQSFESRLAEVCGTFTGSDGLVHPAIRTYAHLSARTSAMGDPCGLVGNGKLHEAMAAVEQVGLSMAETSLRYDDVLASIEIERQRVEAQCGLTVQLAEYQWVTDGKRNDLEAEVRDAQNAKGVLDRARQDAGVFAHLTKCIVGAGGSDCPAAAAAAAGYALGLAALDLGQIGLDLSINAKQGEIAGLQRASARWTTLRQCDVAQVDSDATVKNKLLELGHLDLEALKNQYSLKLAYAEVQKLRNEATRAVAEQEEMQQQTINVEAARNDPNVRVYKNDSVILADDTFNAALRDAYKATKAFEYYTSQSYPHLIDLFLVRMVAHGDYNLETYLADLENAYRDFQQQYGNPDNRVEIISLRDDVLAIPRLDSTGRALTQSERIALFRERLTQASRLDERGYRTLPFSTTIDRLSPLTRNHKITAVEAEIIGSDVGDTVGRVYVRQRGTGMIASVAGDRSYYRFPERTAVMNAFFNGVRVFGPEVYRSDRMRDRPFVNTHWELIVNQRDELANQDINLQSLTDIRLYVYYTDFTQF